jgi:DNA-binding transcriptional regulator GbsR (MarR family)
VPRALRVSPAEREIISLFVRLASTLALPRSIGEIYGLLFCAGESLCFEDIVSRLSISTGSVSQGLRFLRNMGAVDVVYEPGDRRDHYTAQTSLRSLTAGFLREKIEPQLKAGNDSLARIDEIEKQNDGAGRQHLATRVELLRNWHRRAAALIPMVTKTLG